MIGTLIQVHWLNLRRDAVALGLTFVLPIVFFSIFAVIFGGMASGGGTPAGSMKVIAVDEDDTETSGRFLEALGDQDALEIVTAPRAKEGEPPPEAYTRETARLAVRTGQRSIAVVIPKGFGASFGSFGSSGEPVTMIYDPANPLAQHTVAGLIQASAMMAAPDVLMEQGLAQLETYGGALTPDQRSAVDDILPVLRGEKTWDDLADEDDPDVPDAPDAAGDAGGAPAFTGLVQVDAVSAREAEEASEDDDSTEASQIISYYAAGIGVMFLLFSMAGAAGSLLEEEESGTLERVLSSNVGMGTLLAGGWIFFTLVGIVQLIVMFVWGAIVFGLDLFTVKHLVGFATMTLVTAPAAAAFGIMLATLCRSRAQLSGISTVVILVMSALGGSMVPRFVMPAFMNTTAKFTFNGWALDGYLKVFWHDDPSAGILASVAALGPELAVLAGMSVVFLLVARTLARRWETT